MRNLPEVSIILAVGKSDQLGLNNGLPDWNCPGDLKRFKHLTLNKVLIVGRTTLESLPPKMLGRDLICVTRNSNYKLPSMYCNSLRTAPSFEAAVMDAKRARKEIMVIGGKSLYIQALGANIVEYIYLTRVNYDGPADIDLNTSFLKSYKPMFVEEDKLGNTFSVLERERHSYRIAV